LVPAAFLVPVPLLAGFVAAALAGARFVVVLGAFVDFDAAVLGFVLADPELFDRTAVERRVFLGELPMGNAFPTALPALVAAPPTALPAVAAAPPTALPAVAAAPPTALPGPDEATDSAALPTVPAALPTVFPTFLPTLFRSLPVSGIFVLLIHPAGERSTVVWPCIRHARPPDARAHGGCAPA
jgi:hypothetical protein